MVSNYHQILQINSTIPNQFSLDDPKRIRRSLWDYIAHGKEKKDLDEKLKQSVQLFFQQRYRFSDQDSFEKVWERLGKKIWNPKNALTAGILRRIDDEFKKSLFYHGEGIHPPIDSLQSNNEVQKIVRSLLHGSPLTADIIKEKNIKAVMLSLDSKLMDQFRNELQKELNNLSENLPKDSKEEVVWRAFLGNIIAILPFSYPNNGDEIILPVLKDGNCEKTAYVIEVISLDFEEDCTPIPALGLIPKNSPSPPPILVYIGTTYPAGNGFAATLLGDFTPGHSVGEVIYDKNKNRIDQWLEDKKNVHVVGISLGGAMALHTLRHHHEISRVDAYSPPGLNAEDWKKGIGSKCNLNIYCQPGDIVTHVGSWPTEENVSLYTIIPHQKDLPENPLSVHARAFTGCDRITVIKESPEEENQSFGRRLITMLHRLLAPIFIYLPIKLVLAVRYLCLKIYTFSVWCFDKIRNF